jgi:hypothetical protein
MAKEILVEVFHARPSEVEEMIQRRLEEKELVEVHRVLHGNYKAWPCFCGLLK